MYKKFIVSACIFVVILAGCGKGKVVEGQPNAVVNDSILKSLPKATAVLEEIREDLKLNGRIIPDESKQASVYALVSGRISQMNVELGDLVRKGQTLAVLKSAEVAGVANELELAKSNVEITRKNMESYKELYESNLVPEREYISSKAEYQKAQSELEKAKHVADITGGVNSAYLLTSPINGYLIAKNITNNSEVRSDMAEPLFSIADLSEVWILADVYEVDIPSIRLGQEVLAHTLSEPDKTFRGKIEKIYNVLDPETRTMKIRVSLNNDKKDLMPGMFVSVSVDVNKDRKAVSIPSAAIIMDGSDKYVITLQGENQLKIKKVMEILRTGNKSYVSGIEDGETVICESQVFLYQALK